MSYVQSDIPFHLLQGIQTKLMRWGTGWVVLRSMRNLLSQENQMFKVGKIVNNQNKLYKERKNRKE